MKKKMWHKNGFLLIELLIAFALSSMCVMLCSCYVAQLIKQYCQALDRLEVMQQAQNIFERCLHNELKDGAAPGSVKIKSCAPSISLPEPFTMPKKVTVSCIEVTCGNQTPVMLGGCVHDS